MPLTTKSGFVLSTQTAGNLKSTLEAVQALKNDGWKIVDLTIEEKTPAGGAEKISLGVIKLEKGL